MPSFRICELVTALITQPHELPRTIFPSPTWGRGPPIPGRLTRVRNSAVAHVTLPPVAHNALPHETCLS